MVGAIVASPTLPGLPGLEVNPHCWIGSSLPERPPKRPRGRVGAGWRTSGGWVRSQKAEKEGRRGEELEAEGTADCAEPMRAAGRGGTKFPSANDKPEFTKASLASPPHRLTGDGTMRCWCLQYSDSWTLVAASCDFGVLSFPSLISARGCLGQPAFQFVSGH